MNNSKNKGPAEHGKGAAREREDRLARSAAALRENLKRRKEQLRERGASEAAEPKET